MEEPMEERMDDASTYSEDALLSITIKHRNMEHQLFFEENKTVKELFGEIHLFLGIPPANQKILVPKGPMLKFPCKNEDQPLTDLDGKTLTLIGSSAAEVGTMKAVAQKVATRNAELRKRARRQPAIRKSAPSKYTFKKILPLNSLPNPQRSLDLLHKLANDRGIVWAMKKHKFEVALLTEMEPLSHTEMSHEGTSRTLGLNRNQGEVIELRLRTDAYDGYRDYKTIRKTLCHELAHNVHGPHDDKFWKLCHQIEKEVQENDTTVGGHTLAPVSRYTISGQDDMEEQDEEGWNGGEFRLGGIGPPREGMDRRQILLEAAMKRREKDASGEGEASTASKELARRRSDHSRRGSSAGPS